MQTAHVYATYTKFEEKLNQRLAELKAAGKEVKDIKHTALYNLTDGAYFSAIILYDTPARGSHVIS